MPSSCRAAKKRKWGGDLAGTIERQTTREKDAGGRGDVDNVTLSLFEHVLRRQLRANDHSLCMARRPEKRKEK